MPVAISSVPCSRVSMGFLTPRTSTVTEIMLNSPPSTEARMAIQRKRPTKASSSSLASLACSRSLPMAVSTSGWNFPSISSSEYFPRACTACSRWPCCRSRSSSSKRYSLASKNAVMRATRSSSAGLVGKASASVSLTALLRKASMASSRCCFDSSTPTFAVGLSVISRSMRCLKWR